MLPEHWEKAQDEIFKLKNENAGLLTDLEDCKDSLCDLQPWEQITDDSVQKEWERILGAIDGLVYEIMVDAKDDALYSTWKKLRQDRKQLRVIQMIKESDVRAWAQFACSNFLILSIVIQWILDEYIFRNEFPLSIDSNEIGFIKEIEKGVRQSNNKRGG